MSSMNSNIEVKSEFLDLDDFVIHHSSAQNFNTIPEMQGVSNNIENETEIYIKEELIIPTSPDSSNVFSSQKILENKKLRHEKNKVKTHKKSKPQSSFECYHCKKIFSRKYHLKTHIELHIKKSVLVTDDDEAGSILKKMTENQEILKCSICNVTFAFKCSLKRHIQQKHISNVKNYNCDICEKIYTNRSNFIEHVRHAHNKERVKCVRPYKCYTCSKRFVSLQKLEVHQQFHLEKKQYACFICLKQFKKSYNLTKHMQLRHIEGQAQKERLSSLSRKLPHLCHICGKGFNYQANLNGHILRHSGERPYRCDYCTHGFFTKQVLIHHMRRHLDTKPYNCLICQRGFIRDYQFAAHMKKHAAGETIPEQRKSSELNKFPLYVHKNDSKINIIKCEDSQKVLYKCPICYKAYNNSGIYYHMKTQHSEKEYICDFCGKDFALESQLIIHKRNHTGERPFGCPECNKGFSEKSNLTKHIQRMHSGIVKIENRGRKKKQPVL